jgi:hypothetical protein
MSRGKNQIIAKLERNVYIITKLKQLTYFFGITKRCRHTGSGDLEIAPERNSD